MGVISAMTTSVISLGYETSTSVVSFCDLCFSCLFLYSPPSPLLYLSLHSFYDSLLDTLYIRISQIYHYLSYLESYMCGGGCSLLDTL